MFSYMGGKSKLVKWLDWYFPKDCNKFIDVFGGAGWVVHKSEVSQASQFRVYNDFNTMLANIYTCFAFKYDELHAMMKTYPHGDEQLFLRLQDEIFNQLDWTTVQLGDVKLATEYLYLLQQHFSNEALNGKILPYFHEQRTVDGVNKYLALIKRMERPEIRKTLTGINAVENMDCIDVITKYDSPDTLFYIDPPYFDMEHYYTQDFPKEKHKELSEKLANIQGKFALSYYEWPDMEEFYPKSKFVWQYEKVKKSSSNTKAGTAECDYAKEIIIMNYAPLVSFDN